MKFLIINIKKIILGVLFTLTLVNLGFGQNHFIILVDGGAKTRSHENNPILKNILLDSIPEIIFNKGIPINNEIIKANSNDFFTIAFCGLLSHRKVKHYGYKDLQIDILFPALKNVSIQKDYVHKTGINFSNFDSKKTFIKHVKKELKKQDTYWYGFATISDYALYEILKNNNKKTQNTIIIVLIKDIEFNSQGATSEIAFIKDNLKDYNKTAGIIDETLSVNYHKNEIDKIKSGNISAYYYSLYPKTEDTLSQNFNTDIIEQIEYNEKNSEASLLQYSIILNSSFNKIANKHKSIIDSISFKVYVDDKIISSNTKEYLKGLHKKLLNAGDILYSLKLRSVFHVTGNTGLNAGQVEQIPSTSQWSSFSSDTYANSIFNTSNPLQAQSGSKTDNIVISFLTDDLNNKYFWVYNKSISDDEYIQLNFKENTALINILDNKIYQEAQSRVVYPEQGEAKLFMINKNYQSTVSICNKNYYSGISPIVWAGSINIGGTSCNVKYNNGSRINYYASQISLENGVKIYQGSRVSFNGATMSYGTLKSANNSEDFTSISQEIETESIISIFPNPNLGQLTISATNEDCLIFLVEIYNLTGNKVMEIDNLNNRIIDAELNLKTGTYFIKVSSNNGVLVEKLIIR